MDKWTRDTWLEASLVESYEDSEDVTLPAAQGLIKQSGILSASKDSAAIRVLDNGAGMGQVTDSFFTSAAGATDTTSVDIVCGDIDDGLLGALQKKKDTKKEWSNVQLMKLDATNMEGITDKAFDYIFGNFLYFLVSDPIAALKESLRALRPGGTLSFTTWSLSGPFALLQLAQAHLADYPLSPPNARLIGHWNHPRYVRDQLESTGYTDIQITPFPFTQRAESASAMARKMRHVLMLHTMAWGDERRDKGWELGQTIEKVLRDQQGDGPVEIRSVVLLITAKRPAE